MSHHLRSQEPRFGGKCSTPDVFHFGEFTLDQSRYQLQRDGRTLRLEKRPMELLFLVVEKRGELVSREEVADRLWGTGVFVDIDQGINTAVRKVRRALRDDPEKPRYIETVVGKGYRFAAPVSCNGAILPATSPAQEPRASEAAASGSTGTVAQQAVLPKMKLALVALLVLAVGIATRWLSSSGRPRSTARPAIRSLAVLPLKNLSGDPAQQYLADGMTEAIIGRLSGIHDLKVTSRTSVMRFKDTQPSIPEIGKMLGVDAIVEGSVIREGSRIRVYTQLIRANSDEHFWSETYDRELQDVLALQSDIAQAVAAKVEVTVSGKERTRLTAARHVAPEVYESYLKGQSQFARSNNQAEIERSVTYFEDALRKDPTFAPAYVGWVTHMTTSQLLSWVAPRRNCVPKP
jgi:TolB-like protein/DNA-binding winged helix-turn-helix (wHTH) protein